MYKAILFDLDGTLTDSGEGIMKSVQYALEKIGHPEPDYTKLRCFVGPPLMEQLIRYAGIDEETAAEAVKFYRERYAPTGIFENELYEGIEPMLAELSRQKYRLGVASSKPEPYVIQVLEHFGIRKYFDVIVGSTMEGDRAAKSEVIEEALLRLGLSGERESVILVGDKNYDVLGARACGLECLAVTYGYGSVAELTEASPLKLLDTPEDVTAFFRRTPLRREGIIRRCFRVLVPIGIHYGASILVTVAAAILFAVFENILMSRGTVAPGEDLMYELLMKNAILLTGITGIVSSIPCVILYRNDRRRREYGSLVPSPAGARVGPGSVVMLFLAGFALAILGNILVPVVMELLPESWYVDVLEEAEAGQSLASLIVWIGIVAPLAEEIVFRWLVYLRLRDWMGIWPAVLLSSAAFGIYHMNVPQALYAFLVGIFFAWFLEMSGNIWASFLLHAGANICSLLMQEAGGFAGEDEQRLQLVGTVFFFAAVWSLVHLIWMMVRGSRKGAERGYRAV